MSLPTLTLAVQDFLYCRRRHEKKDEIGGRATNLHTGTLKVRGRFFSVPLCLCGDYPPPLTPSLDKSTESSNSIPK